MRNDRLYGNLESLAAAAFALLETPAEGLTVAQAAVVERRAKAILKSVGRIVATVHESVDENSTEFLK